MEGYIEVMKRIPKSTPDPKIILAPMRFMGRTINVLENGQIEKYTFKQGNMIGGYIMEKKS